MDKKGGGRAMILIACIDENGGILWNHRRLCRDRLLTARILEKARGRTLWMRPYSAALFPEGTPIRLAASCAEAPAGALYFLEDDCPKAAAKKLERLVLYRWNRRYPSDVRLTLPIGSYTLLRREEFPGFSHPILTEEVYKP